MFNLSRRVLASVVVGGFLLTQAAVTSAWTPSSPQVTVSVFGSTLGDYGRSVTVDVAGNIYTTGSFSGTVDFDPGPGITNLTAVGSDSAFVSKLDASGNFVWARSFDGNSYGWSLAVDSAGNVYTAGEFYGTVDFDPGPGITNLTGVGSIDAFVSKLDASGNFVWVKSFEGVPWSLAVDAAGSVYTAGEFYGTVDFDPGAGTSMNLTSAGSADVFVSKLDASGNFVWAKKFGGSLYDSGYSMAVDSVGNVYTTGNFDGTVDFDPDENSTSNLTSAGGGDVFVSKLDASGNFVWAKSFGSPNSDFGQSVAVDSVGNVYTAGSFGGTVDFDPGAGTTNLISNGSGDVFVSKLNATGNFVWAKSFGGLAFDTGTSLAVDAAGNVYTTGYFEGAVDFDPGAGVTNLVSAGSRDAFVSKLNATGNLVWAKSFGGANSDAGFSVAVDAAGNVYTTGSFEDTVDFDPGVGVTNLTSAGSADAFVSKLDALGSAIPTTTTSTTTTAVPVAVRAALTNAPSPLKYRAANKRVTLRWRAVEGATSYVVTTTRGTQRCETTATSCVISRLRNGKAYTYLVYSVNADGVRSDNSTRLTARPGFQVKRTTLKAKRSLKLSSIVTTPSKGKKTWRVTSGRCRISGTRLIAPTTKGTCKLRLASAKRGSYPAMSSTIRITVNK
jgi:hypothetical protein